MKGRFAYQKVGIVGLFKAISKFVEIRCDSWVSDLDGGFQNQELSGPLFLFLKCQIKMDQLNVIISAE